MFLTVEQFVARIGEEEALQIAGLGSRDERVLDTAKIGVELDAARGLVLGYVRARYPNALTAGPELLKGFVADIARWRLRGKGGQQSAMNETVQARYDAAIAHLKAIANGTMTLDIDGPGGDPADEANAGVNRAVLSDMPASRTGSLLEGYR